jgi:hypothetical protein
MNFWIWGIDLNDKAIQISANGKPVNSLNYVLNGDNLIMKIDSSNTFATLLSEKLFFFKLSFRELA